MTPLLLSLVLAAQQGPSLSARLSAVESLRQRASYAAVPYLASLALRRDEPPVLRAAAAEAVAAPGRPQAGRYLLPLLQDPSIEVRCAAVEALAGLGDLQDAQLRRIEGGDPAVEVRFAAARALGARAQLAAVASAARGRKRRAPRLLDRDRTFVDLADGD